MKLKEIKPEVYNQIFANMILGTVDAFVERIGHFYSTKSEILATKRLVGYGIVCTGAFWFKVTIDLIYV